PRTGAPTSTWSALAWGTTAGSSGRGIRSGSRRRARRRSRRRARGRSWSSPVTEAPVGASPRCARRWPPRRAATPSAGGAAGRSVLPPLHLGNKVLTLRAGAGSRPVLLQDAEGARADLPVMMTQAALTLEGLEFHREGSEKPSVGLKHIYAQGAPLAAAHCRFVLRNKGNVMVHALQA